MGRGAEGGVGGGAVRLGAAFALSWKLLLLVLLPWVVGASWLAFLRLGSYLRSELLGAIICFVFLALGIIAIIVQTKILRTALGARPSHTTTSVVVLAALPPLAPMLVFGLF